MSTNPHTALVESLGGIDPLPQCKHGKPLVDGSGEILEPPCGCRYKVEYVPPPTPKLTPLPDKDAGTQADLRWLNQNQDAIEYYYAQQEQRMPTPDNVNTTPTYADIERLGTEINTLKTGLLTRDEDIERLQTQINNLYKYVDSRADEVYENITPIEKRLDALESRPNAPTPTTGAAKPKCGRCGDKKMLPLATCYSSSDGVEKEVKMLCPCVKVGDVVSAEAWRLLPTGSQITPNDLPPYEYYWERTARGWKSSRADVFLETDYLDQEPRTILRIGPATVAMYADGKKLEKEVHDDAKPDKAEEIARECWYAATNANPSRLDAIEAMAAVLRKHGVGHTPTLAEKLSDPEVRPLVEVVRAAQNHANYGFVTRYSLRQIVDSLPPDLREAVEGFH